MPQLSAWLDQSKQPTLKQLEKFAHITHTPLGYLFLSNPPVEELPVPDYRTVAGRAINRPSVDLLETLYAMQRRQTWLREYLLEIDGDPRPFVGSATLDDDPEIAGREMRRSLGLDDEWAARLRTWQEAVGALRLAIEQLGVVAVINGIVGNATNRKLDVEEFRGFALADDIAPLIFVNGADAKSAQMFTLAHEFAHLWLGEYGLSGFENLMPSGTRVEDWCNRAAAEFLAPTDAVRSRWYEVIEQRKPFHALARFFKVSPIVAARRLLDLELIELSRYFEFYRENTLHNQRSEPTGGDFYANQSFRIGEMFARHVLHAALEGRIGFKDAYELTGLRGGTFQKYAGRLGIYLP